jgi:hypothetical protein
MEELNKLNITTIMLSAEKKTCKKKEHALWKPQLQQSNLVIQHCNLVCKSTRHCLKTDNRLDHIQSRITETTKTNVEATDKSAKYALIQALKEHDKLLKVNNILREQYLERYWKTWREEIEKIEQL